MTNHFNSYKYMDTIHNLNENEYIAPEIEILQIELQRVINESNTETIGGGDEPDVPIPQG